MRKIALALAAVAALGLTVPVVSTPAEAGPGHGKKVVVIKHKKHWDRGRHYGWQRGHHYGWYKHKHHHHRGHHGAAVVIR